MLFVVWHNVLRLHIIGSDAYCCAAPQPDIGCCNTNTGQFALFQLDGERDCNLSELFAVTILRVLIGQRSQLPVIARLIPATSGVRAPLWEISYSGTISTNRVRRSAPMCFCGLHVRNGPTDHRSSVPHAQFQIKHLVLLFSFLYVRRRTTTEQKKLSEDKRKTRKLRLLVVIRTRR